MENLPLPAASPPAPQRARTLWERRVRDPIVVQLTQGITPEKISLTIAAGGAVALFPVFGVTSVLCFFVALALRLNQPIIQILNQLLLPVHLATILLCVHLGETLFQVPMAERLTLDPRKIHHQYFAHFWSHPIESLTYYLKDNGDSVLYSIVAWALLVPVFVPLTYFALRPVLRSIVKVKAEVAAQRAAATPPSNHPIP